MKTSRETETANSRRASVNGSPALVCQHNVATRWPCSKPATHRVTRNGTPLEWLMCGEHATQRKIPHYTVTALENADISDHADSGRGA